MMACRIRRVMSLFGSLSLGIVDAEHAKVFDTTPPTSPPVNFPSRHTTLNTRLQASHPSPFPSHPSKYTSSVQGRLDIPTHSIAIPPQLPFPVPYPQLSQTPLTDAQVLRIMPPDLFSTGIAGVTAYLSSLLHSKMSGPLHQKTVGVVIGRPGCDSAKPTSVGCPPKPPSFIFHHHTDLVASYPTRESKRRMATSFIDPSQMRYSRRKSSASRYCCPVLAPFPTSGNWEVPDVHRQCKHALYPPNIVSLPMHSLSVVKCVNSRSVGREWEGVQGGG